MCCTTGVSKGPDDTLWVLHRGAKPWDAATFFSGGRAEHITDPTPIRGPVMLQLRQARASGACLEESCSGGGFSCSADVWKLLGRGVAGQVDHASEASAIPAQIPAFISSRISHFNCYCL